MSVSLHEISIVVFIRALNNLSAILTKAEKWADENGTPHSKLLEHSLAPDMAKLPFQIQTCSNSSKGAAVRVAGIEPVSMADDETTFEQLQERIKKTIAILEKVDAKAMDANREKEVVLKTGAGDFKFTSESYLLKFAVPNFYFHETTAYGILRNAGVPIGKMDYLGTL